MEINLAKTAQDNLFDLINTTNAVILNDSDITLGVPSAWEDPEGTNPRNTELTLTAVENSEFTGEVTIHYTRLDLDTLRDGATLEFTNTPSATIEDLRAAIATQLGVVADEIEFDVAEVPDVPDGEDSATVNVSPVADSLLYIGTAAITIWPVQSELSSTVTTTDMDGFDYPPAS